MKTLSAANAANIANRHKMPNILVKFTDLDFTDGSAAQWSTGDLDGYFPGLINVDRVKMSVDMYGGLGNYGDVNLEFEVFAIKNLLQNDDLSNEPVEILAKYGADADIPLWAGMVDEWHYEDGIIVVSCIYDMGLKGQKLPTTQINATNLSSYQIPEHTDGLWIPLTIGKPYRPAGRLVDLQGTNTPKFKFNVAITGHAAIGGTDADGSGDLGWISTRYRYPTLAQLITTNITAGELITLSVGGHEPNFFCSDDIYPTFARTELSKFTNADRAANKDSSDYAELVNPGADGATPANSFDILRLRIPDLGYRGGWYVTTMSFIGKITKTNAVNHAGRTLEYFSWGIEIVDGESIRDTPALAAAILPLGTAHNSYDGGDALPGSIDQTRYTARLGRDISAPASSSVFPAGNMSGLQMNVWCQEEDPAGGGDTADTFRVYVAGFRPTFLVPPDTVDFHGNISGYDDDSSGTYTASASSLIETPVDVVYFILGKVLGQTSFDSASITGARTAYGTYILGGQVLDLTDAEAVLADIAFNSKMTLWRDAAGEWNVKEFDLPGANDKDFDQDAGDFVSGRDGGSEVSLSHSPLEEIANQFDILYEWNEGQNKYNKTESVDESTAGAVGTWLTDSQSKYNITRKKIIEARWLKDDNSADSLRNWAIYRFADRKRIVTFNVSWNGLDLEIGDIVGFNHDGLDITASGGADNAQYEIFSITTDPMSGVIEVECIEANTSHSALTDPT